MTPEKQRSEIAKLCDWKPDLISTDLDGNPWPSDPPDYLNDLNAVHELERKLKEDKHAWAKYGKQLQEVVNYYAVGVVPDYHRDLRSVAFVAHASAAQRCEAFLKVFDKWESQP
jgi:hypothetical protein